MAVADIPFTFIVKGKYWYFRRAGIQARLPGKPGDREFHAKYDEMKGLTNARAESARDTSSFRWLAAEYQASAEFRALAEPTQRDYERTLGLIVAELGDEPFRLTTRTMIKATIYLTTERATSKRGHQEIRHGPRLHPEPSIS